MAENIYTDETMVLDVAFAGEGEDDFDEDADFEIDEAPADPEEKRLTLFESTLEVMPVSEIAPVQIMDDGQWSIESAVYSALSLKFGFLHSYSRDRSGTFSFEAVNELGGTLLHSRTRSKTGESFDVSLLTKEQDALISLTSNGYAVMVEAHATTPARARELVDSLIGTVKARALEPKPEHIYLTFWWQSPQGPNPFTRELVVPEWEKVATNYPSADKIEMLMKAERPDGGKLILWHGPPGTGKTFAVRALAWEWRSWCNTHYITDPERFFADPGYMMKVLMAGGGLSEMHNESELLSAEMGRLIADGTDPEEAHALAQKNLNAKPKERWQLLICEDVGELMAADAADRTGQALSRVLNLTEGLLGQGMNVLLLFTTNESISDLHPAVSRSGRCLNELEFGAFTEETARKWLADNECPDDAVLPKEPTLADLYNIKGKTRIGEKVDRKQNKPQMGFGGR